MFNCVNRVIWISGATKSLPRRLQRLNLTDYPHVDSRICCAQASAQDRAHTTSATDAFHTFVAVRNREYGTV